MRVSASQKTSRIFVIFGALCFGSSIANSQTATPQAAPAQTGTPVAIATVAPTKAPGTAVPPTPRKTAITLSASAYRASLQKELSQIKALENHSPRPLGPILKRLQNPTIVKRPDGGTQSVNGNTISNLERDIQKPANARRTDVLKARQIVENQLKALDEWLDTPPYKPVDAKKIVGDLEASGQIRTGPLWWQEAISNAWKAVARVWKTFTDWLNGLLPSPRNITPSTSAPNMQWLWVVFYAFVVAILAAILWFLWRAFGGKWGRRTVKRDAVLEGEDAQLLSLPPEELRSRADIYAGQGNFREALRHRYLGLLVQLDARGVWRYDTRRTNWEHIAALNRRENLHVLVTPLSALTRRFDRVRYGGAPCDAEQWQQYDSDARQFETQAAPLARSVEVAR